MTALATIHEIDGQTQEPLRSQPDLVVDFNPQSLRLTHETSGPEGSQQAEPGSGRLKQAVPPQPNGHRTELSLELLFDTSRDGTDVRDKTTRLVELARPVGNGNAPVAGRSVRFTWGSFFFNGSIRSLGETVDLFGADGIPLRATLSLTITGVAKRDTRPASAGALGLGAGAGLSAGLSAGFGAAAGVGVAAGAGVSAGIGASFGAGVGASAGAGVGASFGGGLSAGAGASFGGGVSAGAGASFGGGVSAGAGIVAGAGAGASLGGGFGASASAGVGTTPLRLTTAGDTVQSVAARAGVSWKALAAANGIDNPRRLPPGTFLDVRVAVR